MIDSESKFSSIFGQGFSASGEEELLKVASQYALQIDAKQIRCLLYLEDLAQRRGGDDKKRLEAFIARWLEFKAHNNSDVFVMAALQHISLRKFLNEQSFKVAIQK